MSRDIIKTKYSDNEISKTTDFNHTASSPSVHLMAALRWLIGDGTSEFVIVNGLRAKQRATPSMNVDIEAGLGFDMSSDSVLFSSSDVGPVSIQNGDASDRIDTLEIRLVETDFDVQQRSFKDPETGVKSVFDVATKTRIEIEAQVIKGTAGAGVAPSKSPGWSKIAEIHVSAGETVSILDADIENASAILRGTNNTDWTTELTSAFRVDSMSDVKDYLYDLITTSPGFTGVFGIAVTFNNSATFNGNIGINTSAPATRLSILETSTSYPRGILSEQINNGTNAAEIIFRKARGTFATKTAIQSGDVLGALDFQGYDGSAYQLGAYIQAKAAENWGGEIGTNLEFYVTMVGETTPQKIVSISASGLWATKIGINIESPEVKLHIVETSSVYASIFSQISDDANGVSIALRKARGSVGSPAVVSSSDKIGLLNFRGYDGDSYETGAQITLEAAENWGASARGTKLRMYVTKKTTTTLIEALAIEDTGELIEGCLYRTSAGVESLIKIRKKRVEIGDWNMDADANINVETNVQTQKILSACVFIRDDIDTNHYNLEKGHSSDPTITTRQGWWTPVSSKTSTLLNLYRLQGGSFDSTSFDSTSFNRGWIYITYLE